MIVECLRRVPTPADALLLGAEYRPGKQQFPVDPGQKYLVYGLRFWGAGYWVDIASEAGYIVVVPLCLFRIVHDQVSAYWRLVTADRGAVELLPEEFSPRYFVDDLSDGSPEAVRAYHKVRQFLLAELPPALLESLRA